MLDIFALYLRHLYPLVPIIHRPSFSQNLLERRDERDEDFLAFLLRCVRSSAKLPVNLCISSLASYTLIQLPISISSAHFTLYDKLHKRCHLASRKLQAQSYAAPKLIHVLTSYCDHIYLGSTGQGKTIQANIMLAKAIQLAFAHSNSLSFLTWSTSAGRSYSASSRML